MQLAGYDVLERLSESSGAELFRGRRLSDGKPVLLRVIKPEAATPRKLASEREAFDLVGRLARPGLQRAYSFEPSQRGWMLVLEDIGAAPLDSQLSRRSLGWPEVLRLAIRLAQALDEIHQAGVTHKNIQPAHIFWSPATGEARIGNFELASSLPEQSQSAQGPASLEGSLSYMSPEQTGRMNRVIDSRTDLYSLGATLYAALTGGPPFEGDDPMELVHSLVARAPQPPRERCPEVPRPISDIVMRLLEKDPEDRYQSALGLKHDLERCLALLDAGKGIEPFELGREDVSPTLRMPQTLYGRTESKERLLRAFGRAADGWAGLFLVAGSTGVGKTALVREIQRPVSLERGYFIEGKFNQYHGVPYHAWVLALTELADQLLTEPSSRLEAHCARLERAVEGNGRVLTEVVPALERILGPQPPVPTLGGAQAQNRFNRVFQGFIRTTADEEHPLVVFLDDLQWIDPASLDLIQALLTDPTLHHFLLIGAYRDNEVDASHPLSLAVEQLEREGAPLERETLQPLSRDHVHALLSDALRQPRAETAALADAIYAKAGGNPFFTRQILHRLENEGLLRFDPAKRRWEWILEAIRSHGLTENVVVMLSERFRHLPQPTQRLLQQAACLGSRFDLGSVSRVAEVTQEQASRDLLPAIERDLLMPSNSEFVFAHDRLQQAAYSLIPDDERPAIHWKIGEQLLRSVQPGERETQLFDIVNQLNLGARLHTTRAEALQLADLNAQAGQKAFSSSAFRAALGYFEQGIRYLGEDGWTDAYPAALALHQQATSAAQLCAQNDRMHELGAVTRQHARSLLDEIPIDETEIRALTARGQFFPAIRHGLRALDRLGLHLSDEPGEEESKRRIEETLVLLDRVTVDGILDLPEMTSAEQLARMSILSQILVPTVPAAPRLLLSCSSFMAETCLRHGNCAYSPLAFVSFAQALCTSEAHVATGYRLAKVAMRLIEQPGAEFLKCHVLSVFAGSIQPWMEPLRQCIPVFEEAVAVGTASGDFIRASYSSFMSCLYASFMGEPLGALEQRIARCLETLASLRQPYILDAVEAVSQTLIPLLREHAQSGSQGFDHARWLSRAHAVGDRISPTRYFLGKLATGYLLGEDDTEPYSAEIVGNLASIQGTFAVPIFYFYDSLALLRRDPSAGRGPRVRANQSKLLALARLAPMNLRHKHDLVEAEIAQAEGHDWQAAQLYERAIDGASRHGFIQDEALACERAGRFYLARGMDQTGRLLLTRARDRFDAWQATAKVRQLDEVLGGAAVGGAEEASSAWGARLDVGSVMKAAQAIAGEIELEKLLVALVTICIQNAGARFGALVLEEDGRWVVRVQKCVDEPGTSFLEPIPLEECDRVSAGIVRFVVRSGEPEILADAARERLFAQDPHVQQHRCKSVLCMPVISLGRPLGVLYLENDLATGAFSRERLQVLEMLVSHAVTSLENAQAYRALRESEEKYRRIVDTAIEGIWSFGPDGLTTFVNARMAEMLGYSREEMKGRPLTDFLFEEDAPDHLRKMEHRQQGLSEVFERRHRHRDGHVVWALVSTTPMVDEEGRFQGSFAMMTDITKRKQIDQELARAGRLESIGRLAGSIAHDFNNLLTAILGSAAFARDALPAASPVRAEIDEIVEAGRRASRLTQQLLAFARRQVVEPRVFDVHDVIGATEPMLRRLLGTNIALVVERNSEPAAVRADPGQIEQVIVNLAVNARDAMPQGGRLSITTRVLSERIRIEVADTGIGMTAEAREHAFEPFFTTKQEGEGTGLGLATCYGIVTQTGGTIGVESELGVGSTFWIELPRAAESVPGPRRREDVDEVTPGRELLLIVEDEPAVRRIAVRALRQRGYHVLEAEDAAAALRLVDESSEPIALLVTDVVMPGMGGFQLADQLRRERPDLRVLFVSGYTEDPALLHAAEHEPAAFLQKPFTASALARKVRELLDAKKPGDPS